MTIQSLFYPRGVAVIGSTSQGKLGYYLIRQLLAGGHDAIYAVNPKAQGMDSVPGYDTVSQIPSPVDLAVIVSPPATVPSVLEDCGRAGVTAAVIITAGFSEVGDRAAEQEVAEVARRNGIRVVGPNCAGIINTRHKLTPALETIPPAGGVSIIAQSGAVAGVFLAWAKEFGLGVSKFVSYGNGADLREIELLRYLAEDPDTDVVALYIESVSNGPEFMQAARECTRRKPLVVVKSGRSQSGQRATLSHTGSIAGADAVYDAALRQCGAIRVETIEELFDLCKAFAWLPTCDGKRVAIVTNSGGPGVMAADWAEGIGLEIPEPSSTTKAKLAKFLPSYCAFKNPIDLTVEGNEQNYRKTLLAVLDEYDAALALNIAPAYLDSVPLARGVCDAAEKSGKPVVASFLPAQIVTEAVSTLQERGIPNFATGERALSALYHAAHHHTKQEAWRSLPAAAPAQGALPGTGQVLEHEALAWLADNGIPVPEYRFASTPEATIQGCREIGYPVAVKVVSPDILHKSDVGGVELNIQDDDAAATAFARMQRAAAGKDFRGVVIYPMIHGGQEVLIGLSRDPQFGPVIAFGLGGIYTEVWRDVVLRIAPLDRPEAEAMIREIRSLPLLKGARGHEPADLDTLADLLVEFSQFPFRYPELGEVDLNPVFLFSKGLLVGDVRIIRRSEQ